MNKLKTFFQTFYKSLIDFSYYQDVFNASISFSLKYIFILFLFLQFFTGIFFAKELALLIPKVPNFVNQVKMTSRNLFPNDLIINFNNGKLRTNVDEPYFIEFPENLATHQPKKHFITIDTKAKVEDIKKYRTLILVTANALVLPDKDQGYRIQFLDEIKGQFQIDKPNYNLILKKLLPFLDYIPVLIYMLITLSILFFPLLTAGLILISKLVYLYFFSLILFLLAKIMNKNIGYKKVFQLAIHASTLPILISYLAGWINLTIPAFSLSTVLLLFMIFVFSKLKTI